MAGRGRVLAPVWIGLAVAVAVVAAVVAAQEVEPGAADWKNRPVAERRRIIAERKAEWAERAAEPAGPPEAEHLQLLRRIAAAAERQAEALERLEGCACAGER